MRMTASWSGSKRTYRIQVCGAKREMRPPSDEHADINRRHQTLKLRKGPSRGSSSLREPDRQATGRRTALPAPNKELAINRKQPLDRKSPIQVPPLLQRGVVCELPTGLRRFAREARRPRAQAAQRMSSATRMSRTRNRAWRETSAFEEQVIETFAHDRGTLGYRFRCDRWSARRQTVLHAPAAAE